MGAGGSIESEADLKASYESKKAGLSSAQRQELEETYAKVCGKNEFLIIGKCKQAYAKLVPDDADPAFLPKPKAADLRRAQAEQAPVAREPAKRPPPPEGIERFKLTDLPAKLDEARALGKTPLILDEFGNADKYFGYSGSFHVVDAAKKAAAVSVAKEPSDAVLDSMRLQVVHSMRTGIGLVVACFKAAPTFSELSGNGTFPRTLFVEGGKAFINVEGEFGAPSDNAATSALFRKNDPEPNSDVAVCLASFHVVVTSQFASNDVDAFLFTEACLGLDKTLFKIYEVAGPDEAE
ncbi:hypothetical protein M885DRAFT_542415 [Pelagophyceae sp. CCMP2097]|nr:hypothetical protein M885DRAFT_542415 [Pelagophyceae sp. CCMP2097]